MLAVRAILAFLLLPGIMAGLFPALISLIPGGRLPPTAFAWAPLLLGLAILVAAVVSFYRRGKGTLAPWDPPTRLVVQDLYRFNRNPMYVGILLMLLGWCGLAGSLWHLVYAAFLALAFHLRIVLYEEKEMARLFPRDWPDYSRHVPRWGWRFRPYVGSGANGAGDGLRSPPDEG
jgi:protein-S-isoprenylcysteine O-methyltransferase Ste14